jgi:hypothetical protein
MTWHYCNPVQACNYRTKYNTCSGTCLGTRYKECWYAFLKYGRNPSCGTETYAYACTYNCNPYTEAYNCRTNYECGTYQECNNVNYDCSYYQTITGYYTGTCSSSRTICDTATDYDNCITWSERQVAYDCSEMKLNNYGISASNEKVGTPILAIFNISGCSGAVNYELYMKNANIKGTANCGFNSLEITPASAGTQTVLLKLNDGKTSISKIIGTILITNPNGETDSINPFIPTGETFTKSAESGAYDAKIMEWIKQGLGNEDILKNLMITFGAVGLAITATQANRIKEYLNKIKWNAFLSPFIAIGDFFKGFFFGSNENSSQAELSGEFMGGLFLIGDIRDFIISTLSLFGINKKEFDPTLLALSGFGIFLDFADGSNIADGFMASLKTAWKSLPKTAKSNIDEFFKLIKNSDEMKQVYDLLKRIPVNKIALFFNSAHELLRKTPLKYLEDLVSLFLRLINYSDELTVALFKKCANWQDAARITRYFDNFGEEAFEQLTKNHSADEIYEIILKQTDELIDITQINTKLVKRLKNLEIYDSFDSIKIMTKKEAEEFGADLAAELTDEGKRILYIQEDLYNNANLIKDYDLLHENYELDTINLHPTKLKIMNKINDNKMLSQLSQANKKELQEVIYDRLIADNALIKKHPEYINEIIDINDVITDLNRDILFNKNEDILDGMIKVTYYESVTKKSIIEELFFDENYKNIYNIIKDLMEGFL